MLYRGLLGTGYSGSVGALTGSHARGSQYFRQRIVPIDPNTALQQSTRQAMTAVSEDWGSLGPEYWAAWAAFASSVRRTNVLGEATQRTGFQEYVRWASSRYFANLVTGEGLPLFPAVPTGPQIQIDFQINAAIQTANTEFYMSIDTSQPWWQTDDNALLIWVGVGRGAAEPPVMQYMQPTHHYWRGPWQLVGLIRGLGSTNFTKTLPATMVPGQKVPWKARLTTRYQGLSGIVGGHAVAP